MIPNEEVWHYLVVKKSTFLTGIASKHVGDFYCLNCFHSFRPKNHRKKYVKIKILVIL